jgi:hypothetical protein
LRVNISIFGNFSCPLWVKSRHVQCTRRCPLYLR